MKKIVTLCFILLCTSYFFVEKTYASGIDKWIEIDDTMITFNYLILLKREPVKHMIIKQK